jgi:hypothetical protein
MGASHRGDQVGVGPQLPIRFQEQAEEVRLSFGEPDAVASVEQVIASVVQRDQRGCASLHDIHIASPGAQAHEDKQKTSLISLWCFFINAS